jgi:hypothetical protein
MDSGKNSRKMLHGSVATLQIFPLLKIFSHIPMLALLLFLLYCESGIVVDNYHLSAGNNA